MGIFDDLKNKGVAAMPSDQPTGTLPEHDKKDLQKQCVVINIYCGDCCEKPKKVS
jgi:hypothetical protein